VVRQAAPLPNSASKPQAKFGAGKFCRFAQNEHLKIQNLAKSCEAKGEAGKRTENQKIFNN